MKSRIKYSDFVATRELNKKDYTFRAISPLTTQSTAGAISRSDTFILYKDQNSKFQIPNLKTQIPNCKILLNLEFEASIFEFCNFFAKSGKKESTLSLPAPAFDLPAYALSLPAHAFSFPTFAGSLPAHAFSFPAFAGSMPAPAFSFPTFAGSLPARAFSFPTFAGRLIADAGNEQFFNLFS